jgi:hypothetical protein
MGEIGGWRRVGELESWRVGEWRVESGKWRVESGEWKVESGEWRVDSREGRKTNLFDVLKAQGFRAVAAPGNLIWSLGFRV